MSQSGVVTLSEAVDEYFINRMIDKKKNFPAYLTIAKRSWQKMYWNTLFAVQSTWHTVQIGDPYDYVYMPKNTVRFLNASIEDRHGRIQPLFYADQLNIISKPKTQKCGCTACKCDGVCDDIGATSVTTKLIFTVNNVNYYEKCWIKLCPNGDIIQWCEIPTKSYNDRIGTFGDYNADYNDDWLKGNPGLDNFTIVYEKFQTKICALEVRPCGCPIDNEANRIIINTCCSGFLPFWTLRNRHQPTFMDEINSKGYGEVKLSEDGRKLYFKPTRHWHNHCNKDPKIPKFLLLNCQTSGVDCTEEVLVPEYGLDFLWADMDWRAKRFNSKYSLNEKQESKYQRNDEENKLIMFLNPLSLQELQNVQDGVIKW